MFQSVKDFIGQNWLATTISILAILYAVYEARRRRGPRLVYQFSGQRLIGTRFDQLPPSVEIRFGGSSLTNLSQTQIVVWNRGDSPMRNDDVPAHDPIRFSFGPQARVFLAEVARSTRDVNNVAVSYEAGVSNGVVLSFDFLDREDGALISIWHDSVETTPDASGTVLGQKEGPISYGRFLAPRNIAPPSKQSTSDFVMWTMFRLMRTKVMQTIMPLIIVVLGLGLAISPFLYNLGLHITSSPPTTVSTVIGVAMGSFYALSGIFFYNIARRRFPKSLLPEEYSVDRSDADGASDEGHSHSAE